MSASDPLGVLRPFIVMEAISSTALECGCGECLTCRAAAGDEEAMIEVFLAVAIKR